MMRRVTRGGKTYVARGDKLIEIVSADDPRVAASAKRSKVEPFVKVPLWWIAQATKATNTGRALVCIELLYAAWKAKRPTFPLPNGRLARLGIKRETKRRALYDLERAGLITVERPRRKTPIITLVVM
jgi:hypothetical protein